MYSFARLAISAAPVLIGAFLLINVGDDITQTKAAAHWPTIRGEIKHVSTHMHLPTMYGSSRQDQLRYEYEVEGVTYNGRRASFGGGGISEYAPGQIVEVYYDPADHHSSVLSVEQQSAHMLRLVLGIGFCYAGYFLWKRLR